MPWPQTWPPLGHGQGKVGHIQAMRSLFFFKDSVKSGGWILGPSFHRIKLEMSNLDHPQHNEEMGSTYLGMQMLNYATKCQRKKMPTQL